MASSIGSDDARGSAEFADDVLAGRVAAGDAAAFAELYDRYVRPVYVFAAHVLGPTRAEDVVQDAFLALWRNAHRYDSRRSAFATWFMAVARHRVVDELRHRAVEQRVLAVEPVDQLLSEMPDGLPGVADLVGRRERDEDILRALAGLPAEQRRAIVLAYFGGAHARRDLGRARGAARHREEAAAARPAEAASHDGRASASRPGSYFREEGGVNGLRPHTGAARAVRARCTRAGRAIRGRAPPRELRGVPRAGRGVRIAAAGRAAGARARCGRALGPPAEAGAAPDPGGRARCGRAGARSRLGRRVPTGVRPRERSPRRARTATRSRGARLRGRRLARDRQGLPAHHSGAWAVRAFVRQALHAAGPVRRGRVRESATGGAQGARLPSLAHRRRPDEAGGRPDRPRRLRTGRLQGAAPRSEVRRRRADVAKAGSRCACRHASAHLARVRRPAGMVARRDR